MVDPSRYLKIGPGGRNCACCFPAPRSKDRRKQFRIAKRKAEREALKQAEADMVDIWAEYTEWLEAMEAEDQHWSDYDNGVMYDTEMSYYNEPLYDETWYDDDDYYYEGEGHLHDRNIQLAHPPGAISSLDELKNWHSWVWVASREFHTCLERKHAGDINLSEMVDYNILNLNGYNDWFVFANKLDAEAWANNR